MEIQTVSKKCDDILNNEESCTTQTANESVTCQINSKLNFGSIWTQLVRPVNIIRSVVIVLLSTWFIYNFSIVIEQYVKYNTTVFMQHKMPYKTLPPGITVCSFCIYCGYVLDFYPPIECVNLGTQTIEPI